MEYNYFFEYLIKNPGLSRQVKEQTVRYLQDAVRNGKLLDSSKGQGARNLFNKDATKNAPITNRDLALFSKDIYTILYPKMLEERSGRHTKSPDTITPEECFNLSFNADGWKLEPLVLEDPSAQPEFCYNYDSWMGEFLLDKYFKPFKELNPLAPAEHALIRFNPYDKDFNLSGSVQPQATSKYVYLNISPQNCLNVAREVATAHKRFVCYFNTDPESSNSFVFRTDDRQLSEVEEFLNELQTTHPEYLEPADCNLPFCAQFGQACGISDQNRLRGISFEDEVSETLSAPINDLYSQIMQKLNCKSAIYSVGNKGYNAENFSKYTAWQKTCDKIHEMKTKYANAKTNAELQSKAYYDELWEQFLKAKTNPESQMAKDIDALGNALYKSIQSGEPLRQNIILPTYTKRENSHDDLKNIKKISTIEGAKYCDQLDLNFNFHREIFNTLGGEKLLQEKLNAENFSQIFGADLEEHHLSPDYIFMNTETASKYDEYHRDYIRGNIDYSTSPAPQQNQQAQQH